MRTSITLILLLASFNSFAQVENTNTVVRNNNSGFRFEFFVLPAIAYNHANIGFSYRTSKAFEHNLSLGSSYGINDGKKFNLNLSYNLNTYFKNKKIYIPVWFNIANTRRVTGYEDGYHPHTLRYSIGTGIGTLLDLSAKWKLRTEVGVGAGVNLTNTGGKVLSLDLNLSEYDYDQKYPDQNPHLIPTFRFKIAFVYLLCNNKM